MNLPTAVEELQFHCGAHPDIDDPRWEAGVLQKFKHYSGSLDREAWDRMLACVDVVAEHLRTSPQLDRRVVSSLWAICHFTRSWGLAPDGMLRRNGLISDPDRETLAGWVDDLSERIAILLDGQAE